MEQNTLMDSVSEQTRRALWEVKNVIDCIPEELWNKYYCNMPLWKHVYHMIHSLDLWFVNPKDVNFTEPSIHEKDLNNLDVVSQKLLSREEVTHYYSQITNKITQYVENLRDSELLQIPEKCEYNRFTLILAQFRHLHSHMGMLMGFIIDDTGKWPRVVGLEKPIPQGQYDKYF